MQGRRPMRQTGPLGPRGEPLKFDGEFDFESANAQFEEIEKGLDKLKISSGKHSQNSNNDTSLTTSQSIQLSDLQDQHLIMKQKSMNADNSDKQQQQDMHGNNDENKHFYDKNTSFFDRISCEANEKNPSKSKNWKEERKINAETFGLMQRNLADKLNNRYNSSSQSNYRQNNRYNSSQSNNYRQNNGNNNGTSMHQGRSNNSNSNSNQRYNNTNQSRGIAVGGGSRHNQNNRRNDLDSSYGNQRNGRRFGSR